MVLENLIQIFSIFFWDSTFKFTVFEGGWGETRVGTSKRNETPFTFVGKLLIMCVLCVKSLKAIFSQIPLVESLISYEPDIIELTRLLSFMLVRAFSHSKVSIVTLFCWNLLRL